MSAEEYDVTFVFLSSVLDILVTGSLAFHCTPSLPGALDFFPLRLPQQMSSLCNSSLFYSASSLLVLFATLFYSYCILPAVFPLSHHLNRLCLHSALVRSVCDLL